MVYWILALTIILLLLVSQMSSMDKEYFDGSSRDESGEKSRMLEDFTDIYDTYYAKVYDKLFSTPERISFEKKAIQDNALAAWPITETKLLDACCGTSPHSEWMCAEEFDIVGLDSSEAMLQKARERCSRGRFYRGDITRAETFAPKSFSHAMILYFSIYQFRNPKMVLDHLYSWLKPGGVLIIHLVDPLKFDPILDAASPFAMFSLQKYAKERIVDSNVTFDQFTYKSRFVKEKHDDEATFEELLTFKDPTKNDGLKYREHKHRLFMPSVDAMLEIIKSSGFTRHEMVDMTPAGYEYQYLLFFTK
jgi:ubiquinone/menaquinone biosynthesis C-methylase UbiE